ncbi:hypothetical protein AKJ09_04958 [Labilithrix luteola]|uniref:Uncharacterized protein n=1 Tax=Labilithrix luteola TaxID=1391654 RepID=A0A0K1PYS9_9BACT|nr:hypothetical protein AKJ09_04958 [Labilithrix luteola]
MKLDPDGAHVTLENTIATSVLRALCARAPQEVDVLRRHCECEMAVP